MKIVQLINGLEYGGGELLLYDLVLHLQQQHDVEVVCLTRLGPVATMFEKAGIRVSCLHWLKSPNLLAWGRFYHSIKNADVVHSHFFYSDLLAAFFKRLHFVRHWVSTRHDTGTWLSPAHRRIEKYMYQQCDALLCVSEAVRRALSERRVCCDQMHVVRPGTPPCKSSRSPRRATGIIAVGRLEEIKGHDILLRAYALLPRDLRIKNRLTIVGKGRQQTALVALAETLGIADNVSWTGVQNPANTKKLLRSARLFVHPSHDEAMPLALMEAMSHSLPCVATNVGGVPEIIQSGKTGLLVSPNDPKALAHALQTLLKHPKQAKKMASLGAQTMRTKHRRSEYLETVSHFVTSIGTHV